MAVAGVNIGMMSSAYFVGRKAILEWVNQTFSMNLQKIEEFANGAVALQMMDCLFPGSVPMSKVRWNARAAPEMTSNYKLLQQAFDKSGVSKYIEVQTLIRGKYQHNLEFAQFLKSVWEANINEEHLSSYDAVARRRLGKGAESMPIYNPGGVLRSAAAAPKPRSRVDPASANVSASKHPPGARTGRAAAAATSATPAGRAAAAVERLRRENAELKVSVESLEREREFYFSKLRDIEILLQTVPSSDQKLTDAVFKIMYATEDDFEVPEGAPATGCSPELPGEEPSAEEPTVSATPLSDATGNTHEADGKETVLPSAPIGEENVIPGEA